MNVCGVCKRGHAAATKTCPKCLAYNKKWRAENLELTRAHGRAYYANNKAKVSAKSRKANRLNPKKAWTRKLRDRYGMRPGDYDRALAAQGGLCALCNERPEGLGLRIDHNHATGAFRALLCHHCNTGLGHFRDSSERLRAAIDYLAKHARGVS